jgi:hypothetical protein
MNSRASRRAIFYEYFAIVGFDNSVAIGKAETRAVGSRGEKRVEDLVPYLRRNPFAGVLDRDL